MKGQVFEYPVKTTFLLHISYFKKIKFYYFVHMGSILRKCIV